MEIHIRKAHMKDAATLGSLMREIGWFASFQSETHEQTEQRVGRHLALCLAGESHSVYIAETEGGEVAGYTAVHWLPYLFLEGPEGFVSELFVRDLARGRGVGQQLLAAVRAEAEERGCARLSLLNNRERESYKRGFYQKEGWEERPNMANFVYSLPKS